MTSTPTIAFSVILASAAAVAVSFATRAQTEAVAPGGATADLRRELDDLRTRCAALQKQLEDVRTSPVAAPVGGEPQRTAAMPSDEQLIAAVEAALKRRDAQAGKAGAVAAVDAPFDLEKDFAGLVGANFWNNQAVWKRAFAAGRMDEVVAKFEALAKANPNDIQAQMNLANAYMAYQQLEPSKYENSMKADKVYDHVLELEPTHWEARFTKAVSYTFWPDFLGKKKEAISHFETLVKQQDSMPAEDYQAQTYLYLGNLLEQSDPARAKEMWQKGAKRHPNNAELRKKSGG